MVTGRDNFSWGGGGAGDFPAFAAALVGLGEDDWLAAAGGAPMGISGDCPLAAPNRQAPCSLSRTGEGPAGPSLSVRRFSGKPNSSQARKTRGTGSSLRILPTVVHVFTLTVCQRKN